MSSGAIVFSESNDQHRCCNYYPIFKRVRVAHHFNFFFLHNIECIVSKNMSSFQIFRLQKRRKCILGIWKCKNSEIMRILRIWKKKLRSLHDSSLVIIILSQINSMKGASTSIRIAEVSLFLFRNRWIWHCTVFDQASKINFSKMKRKSKYNERNKQIVFYSPWEKREQTTVFVFPTIIWLSNCHGVVTICLFEVGV